MTTFQIDDYYEAVALYRLLLSYKYAPNPMHREIFGSSLIAGLHIRLAQALTEMEQDRVENSQGWMPALAIDSPVWQLLVENVATNVGNGWIKLMRDQKVQFANAVLAPFTFDEATRDQFIHTVDTRFTPTV